MSFLFKPRYRIGKKVILEQYDREIRKDVIRTGTVVSRRKSWHSGDDMYRYLVDVGDMVIARFHNELWPDYSESDHNKSEHKT